MHKSTDSKTARGYARPPTSKNILKKVEGERTREPFLPRRALYTVLISTYVLLGCAGNSAGRPAAPAANETIELDFSPSIFTKIAASGNQNRATLVCPRLSESPKIDGAIDESSWKQALVIDTMKPATPATRVQMGFDADHLYVAFTCTQPGGAPIRATKYAHNSGTPWKDDCIEVFLTAEGAEPVQSQFIVNAAGSTFDILGGSSSEGTPRWTSAVKTEGDHWTVEMAIPRALLGVDEWPARFLVNVCRNSPSAQAQSLGADYGHLGAMTMAMKGIAAKSTGKSTATATNIPSDTKAGASGEGLALSFTRNSVLPGQRWLAGKISLSPAVDLDRAHLLVELRGMSNDEPLDVQEIKPTQAEGRLYVDLRAHNLTEGQVVVRLLENGKETSVARALVAAEPPQHPLQAGQKVSLTVDTAPETGPVESWPATICVPFPAGALWDEQRVRLVNGAGAEIPSQTEVLGRWSREGSIKWLRFNASVSSGEKYFVEYPGSEPEAGLDRRASRSQGDLNHGSGAPGGHALPALVTQQSDNQITFDTGVARYVIAKGSSPIREIWLGKQKVATSDGARGLYVIDQKGQLASAAADGEMLVVEANGPQAVCVRLEGFYKTKKGEPLARHITRIEAFAGQPLAKVTHTLVLSRDSNEVWFKDIGWELTVDAGKTTQAVFGVNRDKPAESFRQPLDAGMAAVFMAQDEHYRFVKGTNHFRVASVNGAGAETRLKEGAECGDWAALVGDDVALMVGCAESARQHPKEFEVSADKLTLKLFSPRAGEELDFRSPTLAKMWNVKEWLKVIESVMFESWKPEIGKTAEQLVEQHYGEAEKLESNAIGWAKTHDLVFAPLAAVGGRASLRAVTDPGDDITARGDARPPGALDSLVEHAALIAGTLTFPVYVTVDPNWIYQTDAFGPLHPKDPQRFPEAEEFLQKMTEKYWIGWEERMGLYGIIDFNTGPRDYPSRTDREHWSDMSRYKFAYKVRGDLLLMAARSGERKLMNAAIGSNRVVVDNNFAHWQGPDRIKGGWLINTGGDGVIVSPFSLPMSWQGRTHLEATPTEIPENLINLYYLTGNRRAKEVVDNYAAFMKAEWSPMKLANLYYPMRYFVALVWSYGLNWDRELGDIAQASLEIMHDPESPLRVGVFTLSPTYKIQQEVRDIIRTQHVLDDPRYYDIAIARSKHLMQGEMLGMYQNSQGIVSSFLYRQTGEPYIGEKAATMLRQVSNWYDPATNQFTAEHILFSSARVGVFMNGIFYGEDAVVRSNADRKPVAAWAGASFWQDDKGTVPGPAGSVFVLKKPKVPLQIQCMGSAIATRGELQIRRINAKEGDWATDLNLLSTYLDGGSQIHIEKYAAEGAYEIKGGQVQYLVANGICPMVLHAPGDWIPYPAQRPFPSIWFKLPSGATDGKIVFEGSARLFDPNGKPFPGDKPVSGEIQIPADRPGLWSFQPLESKKVRVTNLPPFFAFGDSGSYFEPPLPAKAGVPLATAK